MTSNATSGQFLGLMGENCTLLKINGVQQLVTEDGYDIVQLLRNGQLGGGGANEDVASTLSNVLARLDAIETYLQNTPLAQPGPPGPPGPQGEQGEKGDSGPVGRNGKDAKAVKYSDLVDVDTTGIADGAVPMWSEEAKKWVISLD